MAIPELRLRHLNDRPVRADGEFVLYWMVASRRRADNFALEHAVEIARELGKPLVVLEALRVGYRWASDRLHRFVLDGMADNERSFARSPVSYYPYVEPEPGAGKGLLEALASCAAVVVTDDFPSFFIPRMQASAAERLSVRLSAVDSNGLLPLRAADKVFLRAFDFRRFLQRELAPHLSQLPKADPLDRAELPRLPQLPAAILKRWPRASAELLSGSALELGRLPLNHSVAAAPSRGGAAAASAQAESFVRFQLGSYDEQRNHPDALATSGLSPYLHFGHISAHRLFKLIAEQEEWSPEHAGGQRRGQRGGFWNMHPSAEAYLDQLVTWRELGYNFCSLRSDYDRYESLPDWAKQTLALHAGDPRPVLYDLDRLESAQTGDEIWNAAQRELVSTGRMHNYLRMLWGKKLLEWAAAPEQALEWMLHLNNKYALDGRNPNSYSGIFWCLGRYDRAWGPERPIFGTIRYMLSDNTRRKLHLREYLLRYAQLPVDV